MQQEHSTPTSQSSSFNTNQTHINQYGQQDKIKQQNPNYPFQSMIENPSNSIHYQSSQLYPMKSEDLPKKPYVPYQGIIPMKVRNRRFKKLLQLRSSGFFDQQAIKLRHPLLYYLFVGQYEFEQLHSPNSQESDSNSVNLLSSFLSDHLINVEYKHLLSQEMTSEVEKILEIEKNTSEEQIKQIKRLYSTRKLKNNFTNNLNHEKLSIQNESTQMDIESTKIDKLKQQSQKLKEEIPSQEQINWTIKKSQHLRENSEQNTQKGCLSDPQLVTSMYQKATCQDKLTGQDKQIQEQHLIEYCEELFLQGKLVNIQEINYQQIDENVEYDDWKQENKDLEEKYFDQIQDQMDLNSENYYTGIQDY